VPPPAYAVDCRSLAVGSTTYGQMAFQQQSLPCNPRLDGVSVQLVEVFSTPSQQYVGPLSAGLQSMARGDVCIGALHAFGARCTHPPLASGVFSALIRRQDAVPSSQYIGNRSLNGSARQEVLLRLRRNHDENKRNREYYQSMASHLKWSIT
jgi:hypothetical protein